ncbi:DUF3995 domain-containing protein [Leifsonia sp. NPDC080035]|uniref:DUF3995 domain-containing protein n=1 Tax=Leifsonia sp. NPDC080035 TaxID=3143936 RepID=A0AAU7GCD4_9MICO
MKSPSSPRLLRSARIVAGAGIGAVGLLHLVWATGSSWPSRDADALAEAVLGGSAVRMPASACVVVGAPALVAAAATAGAGGERGLARLTRYAAAGALLGRAAAGGVVAARMLGLGNPGTRFQRLDAIVYRPLCLLLGVAALVSARGADRA